MKKGLSVMTAAVLLLTLCGTLLAAAEEKETVRVTVENSRFSVKDGAPWEGSLLDKEVTLREGDSMETVIERAIAESGYTYTVSEYGYISSVNGLAEYACNGSGGWMATLNNWFTADGTSAYTLANKGLQAGDEINVVYTCAWGADVGSMYGDYNTSLSDSFNIEGSCLLQSSVSELTPFTPSVHEYTVTITEPEDVWNVHAFAENKNYQTRFYLNAYTPETEGADYRGGRHIPVSDGDTLYIGVGEPAWPSMNSWGGVAEATVYTFHIRSVVMGDLNQNGVQDIEDVTALQRVLADFDTLTAEQTALADMDGDNAITIGDATVMQRILAEFDV